MQEIDRILKRIEERLASKRTEATKFERWCKKRQQEEILKKEERLKETHEINKFLLEASGAELFFKELQQKWGGKVATKTNQTSVYYSRPDIATGLGGGRHEDHYAYTQLTWAEGKGPLSFRQRVRKAIRVKAEKIGIYDNHELSISTGRESWERIIGSYEIKVSRQGTGFEMTWPINPTIIHHRAGRSEEKILPHKMSLEELKMRIQNNIASAFVGMYKG